MTEFDPHTWAEALIVDALASLGPDRERVAAALEALHRSVTERLPGLEARTRASEIRGAALPDPEGEKP